MGIPKQICQSSYCLIMSMNSAQEAAVKKQYQRVEWFMVQLDERQFSTKIQRSIVLLIYSRTVRTERIKEITL